MDPKSIAKQMIVFNKTAVDNNFRAMQAWHEQTERVVNMFWEKSPMFPEEGKKAIAEWMTAYKKVVMILRNLWMTILRRLMNFSKKRVERYL